VLVGQYTIRDGALTITNLTNSYSPNSFVTIPGNITTSSRSGRQTLSRISGSNVMSLTCSYCFIELQENAGDFAGTYRAESRRNNQVTVQGKGVSPSGTGTGVISGIITGGSSNGTLTLATDWSVLVNFN
jgi:hypothetical protein